MMVAIVGDRVARGGNFPPHCTMQLRGVHLHRESDVITPIYTLHDIIVRL